MTGLERTTSLDAASSALRRGEVVAIPTETVYGLAADASDEGGIRRVFAIKGRPASHPVIVHLGDPTHLGRWVCEIPPEATALAAAFWPGPMTLVLRRSAGVSDLVTGGRETVAVRVPSHPLALALLQRFGGGVVAPSANRFGSVSPTTAAHVVADYRGRPLRPALVLDGGPCQVGLESTIVDLSGLPAAAPVILRAGAVTRAAVERVLGQRLGSDSDTAAPGTLPAHYQPAARVEVCSEGELPDRIAALEAAGQRVVVALAELAGEPARYAQQLYGALRAADNAGADVVLLPEVATEGLGEAIMDRLRRAAAPR